VDAEYKPLATPGFGVTRDASLDDFATGGETDGPDEEPSDPETEREGEPEATSGVDPEPESRTGETPAEPTHEWSPDGAVCGECGDSVGRLWRSGSTGDMVCDHCKEW
jgi:hypothetical protein